MLESRSDYPIALLALRRWLADVDDRGVVWMRFGAPDRRATWIRPGTYGTAGEASTALRFCGSRAL